MLTKFYDIILSVVNELIRCEQMTQYITDDDFFWKKIQILCGKINQIWSEESHLIYKQLEHNPVSISPTLLTITTTKLTPECDVRVPL